MVRTVGRWRYHECLVALSIALVGCTSSAPQDGAGPGGGRAGSGAGGSGVSGGGGFNGGGGTTIAGTGGGGGGSAVGGGGTTIAGAGGGGAVGGSAVGGGGSPPAGAGGAASVAGAAGTAGTAGTSASCPPLGSRIDIPATPISGKVTINGARVGDENTSGADVSLSRTTGSTFPDRALLPYDGTGAYSALIMPGTYDVRYAARQFGGPGAPTNTGATLRRGIVVGASPLSLDVDVPAATISLTVTVAGKSFKDAVYNDDGAFSLLGADGDSALLTGNATSKGAYTALVVPGTYDLVYAGSTASSTLPTNKAARIQTGIVVGTSPVSLKADVAATKVSVALMIAGAAAPRASDIPIDLSLRTAAGDVVTLTPDSPSSNTFSALAVPGTYDVYYGGTTVVPRAQSGKVKSGIVVGTTPLSVKVDVPGTPVSITATINDLPLASDMGLYLQDAAGLTFVLRTSGSATPVTPGTYDLYYNQGSVTGSKPLNQNTRIKTGILVGSAPVSLDMTIPVATLSGKITLNGAALSDPKMSDGDLFLSDGTGGSVRLTRVTAGTYSAQVISGTYDLYYKVTSDKEGVPANSNALIKKGIVVGVSSSPIALDLEVPFVTVASTATVNGAPIPATSNNRGIVQFHGDHGDVALVVPVSSSTAGIPVPVIPGSYGLYYSLYVFGPSVPINGQGYIGCVTVR